MAKKVEEFIICKCESMNHFLYFVVTYDKWDEKYCKCEANFFLNPKCNMLGRLWVAIKYVLGYHYIDAFDKVTIDEERAAKITNVMDMYQRTAKLIKGDGHES